jgi:hypothetical protein
MGAFALESLHVLITGVEASLSRDVVRLFTAQGAAVMAADNDMAKLARLDRDVSLYRARVETALINTSSASELRLFEANLRLLGKLPHLMICCCAAHGPAHSGGSRPVRIAEVSAKPRPPCAGVLAAQILQPSLFLHVEPTRARFAGLGFVGRGLSALAYPTLLAVLERKPGRGIFNPDAFVPYVRIASHVYSLQRQMDRASASPDGSVRPFSPARRQRQARSDLTTTATRANAA